jgi:hypothetical protein
MLLKKRGIFLFLVWSGNKLYMHNYFDVIYMPKVTKVVCDFTVKLPEFQDLRK